MRSRCAVLGAAALTVLVSSGSLAAPNACVSGKEKCVGKKAATLLKCHAKAEKQGVAVDAACVAKARAKFDGSLLVPPNPAKGCFEKLEGKQDPGAPETLCPTENDTGALEAAVDGFVDDVVTALDPGYPAPVLNACSAGKKKCVLKKAAALLKCHQTAAKQGIAPDPACLQKARDRFDGGVDPSKGCFAKLEARPPCLTTGDTTALETRVEDFVVETLCSVHDSACPTPIVEPTTTPTPRPTPTSTRTPTPTP